MKPTLNVEMDPSLPPGIGYCRTADGQETRILIPDQRPPLDSVSVWLSIEDYVRLMRAARAPI